MFQITLTCPIPYREGKIPDKILYTIAAMAVRVHNCHRCLTVDGLRRDHVIIRLDKLWIQKVFEVFD